MRRMTDILLVLGSNIRKYRKEFGWTQQLLAEKAGISVPFMTQIELGRKSASLEVIQSIAVALGIPYRQLFDEPNTAEPPVRNLLSLEHRLSESIMSVIHEEFGKF